MTEQNEDFELNMAEDVRHHNNPQNADHERMLTKHDVPNAETEHEKSDTKKTLFGVDAKGLPSSQSLRELADVAKAAESRWLGSPSNAKLLAKLAELSPFPAFAAPPGGWAKSCEPVGFPQGLYACFVGNRSILARYFRETEKVNFNVILLFVSMLDPSLAGEQAPRYEIHSRRRGRANPPCVLDLSLSDIADFLDPAPDQKWEIRFVGRKGNTQKELQWRTSVQMDAARFKGRSIKVAVGHIMDESKGSRPQVFRDDKACREYVERLKSVLKELGDDEAKVLQETPCSLDDLLNQAAFADRFFADLTNRFERECALDASALTHSEGSGQGD